MEQVTFWMIVISGLLPVAYMATLNRFPILCQIVILYAAIYAAIPIMLTPIMLTHAKLPYAAMIAPPIGGITALVLYFLIPPRV